MDMSVCFESPAAHLSYDDQHDRVHCLIAPNEERSKGWQLIVCISASFAFVILGSHITSLMGPACNCAETLQLLLGVRVYLLHCILVWCKR